MATREAPGWFRRALVERFGAGHDAEWDGVLQRWVIISPSAAGYPTRQLVVWRRDPATGRPCKPDVAGILPMRELTTDCCHEILRNMERTSLTNRHDGAQQWKHAINATLDHNDAVTEAENRQLAQNFADMIAEVDLRRPWAKHHSNNPIERRIARGG